MPKQQNDTAARPRWNRLWRQRPTPRGSISPNKMNRAAPYLFLAPSLAGLCVFVLVPFADAVRRSFTDAMGSRFVGFANYASVLGNSAFRLAAGNTARFLAIAIPLLHDGSKRAGAIAISALSGIPTVLGALLGYFIGSKAASALSVAMALAGGAMLYVVFFELLPESYRTWKSKWTILATVVGFATGVLLLLSHHG